VSRRRKPTAKLLSLLLGTRQQQNKCSLNVGYPTYNTKPLPLETRRQEFSITCREPTASK